MKQFMHVFIALFLVSLLLSSCGYRPSAKFARSVMGDKISTSIIISPIDPENAVIIKDAVDAAVIEAFHASLTSRENSNSHLTISLGGVSYSPVQYNSDGFIIAYRTTVGLSIVRELNGENKSYSSRGTFDFSITPNAVISDQQRFQAIQSGANKAIQSFIAQVSAEGAREEQCRNNPKDCLVEKN